MIAIIPRTLVAAACMLIVAACGRGGDGAQPGGSASTAPAAVAPSAPPTAAGAPERTADEAAIRALVATVYKQAERTDTGLWPLLTRRFATAWQDCYDLQKKVNAKQGDDSATYGECFEDAGSFIPGQDLDDDVASRTKVTKLAWTSDDSAVATVGMRIFRDDKTDIVVTLRLARENGKWLVDDMDHEAGAAGTGYREGLEQALPSLKRRLSGGT
jgi:hypothetical protein